MDSIRAFVRARWDSIALLIVALVMFGATIPLGRVAAWIPRLVLAVTILLIIVRLVAAGRDYPAAAGEEMAQAVSPHMAALWIVGLTLALLVFGAAFGTAVFCCAYLRGFARESWLISAGFALVLGTGIEILFGIVLQAELHRGWLGALF